MNVKLSTAHRSKKIYHADDIYAILQRILMRENKIRRQQEYFWIVGIDSSRKLVFIELLALGAHNRVMIKAPEAFRMAIYKLADFVMFVHNHPSGRLTPSEDDKNTTDMLLKAGEVVDISVVDHLIISETGYFSFAKEGLIKELRKSSTYQVLHKDQVELLKLQMKGEGVEKGRELGKKEGIKEIAKRLLELGQPVELVMEATGLSKAVVGKMGKNGK